MFKYEWPLKQSSLWLMCLDFIAWETVFISFLIPVIMVKIVVLASNALPLTHHWPVKSYLFFRIQFTGILAAPLPDPRPDRNSVFPLYSVPLCCSFAHSQTCISQCRLRSLWASRTCIVASVSLGSSTMCGAVGLLNEIFQNIFCLIIY